MSSVAHALDAIRNSSEGKNRPGVWVGRVEDVDDPQFMNRARVRIFSIHGDNTQTPTAALPWAEINDLGGGAPDTGSGGAEYKIGSSVWCMFEMGDDRYPVILGGRRGANVQRDEKNPVEFLTVDGTEESTIEKPWVPEIPEEGLNELPVDVFADSADGDRHPTRTVWRKSYKGHTILVEDRDGYEFLRIIDRAGQVIEMDCPVTEEENENNAAQRGSRNAVDNNQLSQDALVNKRGYIRLKDVAGQEIILDGAASNESIRIVSRDRQGASIQQMILSSKKGSEKIEIKDKAGNTFLMDPNAPTPIRIFDATGNALEFDSENGVARLVSSNSNEEVVGGQKTSTVGGKRITQVAGDDSLSVLGNKFLNVMNDLTSSITGLTSLVMTGPLRANIVNAQMSGTVEDFAAVVDLAVGGMDLNSQLCGNGKMRFGALAGDVAVETTAGNVEVGTAFGEAAIKSTLGQLFEDPVGTKIGSSSASEPLVLGNALTSALNDLVNNVFVANAAAWGIGNLGNPVPLSPAVVAAIQAWLVQHVTSTLIVSDTRFTQKV